MSDHRFVFRRAARALPVGGLLLAIAAVLLGLLLAATPAQAHAELESTNPVDGEVLTKSPATLSLSFSEPVRLAADGNRILDVAGAESTARFTVRDNQLVVKPEAELADGSYVLAWRVTSADGHPISGGLQFAVGEPSGEVVVAASEERREVQLVRVLAAAVRYLGFAVAVGLALFAGLVWTGRSPALTRTLNAWAIGGLSLGLLGHFVLVPTNAVWQGGGSWSSLSNQAVWQDSQDGWSMLAFIALVFTAVLASVALRRRSGPLAIFALAVLIVAWAAEGHTRSVTPTWLVVAADAAHIGAAVFWLGGLVGLLLLLLCNPALGVAETARTVSRFSTAAAGAVLALVVAGIVMFYRIAPTWSTLWETGYGRLVIAKVVIVAVPVLGLAAWNRWGLVPRVTAAGRENPVARGTLTQTVRAEAVLLVVVLCLTGALVAQSPRTDSGTTVANTQRATGAQTLHLDLGETRHAMLRVDPIQRGTNQVSVAVLDGADQAIPLAGQLTLKATQQEAGVGPIEVALSDRGAGKFTGTVELPMQGKWTFSLSVPLSEFENPVVGGDFLVP